MTVMMMMMPMIVMSMMVIMVMKVTTRLDFGRFPCCGATPSMFLLSAVTNRGTDTGTHWYCNALLLSQIGTILQCNAMQCCG